MHDFIYWSGWCDWEAFQWHAVIVWWCNNTIDCTDGDKCDHGSDCSYKETKGSFYPMIQLCVSSSFQWKWDPRVVVQSEAILCLNAVVLYFKEGRLAIDKFLYLWKRPFFSPQLYSMVHFSWPLTLHTVPDTHNTTHHLFITLYHF